MLRYFAQDFTASDTAQLTFMSTRSINTIFLKLRKLITDECVNQTPYKEVIELDEPYFGPRRIRGKRDQEASGKTIVLNIFKRADTIYAKIVSDALKSFLIKEIRSHMFEPKAVLIPTV